MFPRLFEIHIPFVGNVPINTYGVMIMVGFIVAALVAVRRAKRAGLDGDFALDLAIIAMIVGLVGAKILYVAQVASKAKVETMGERDLQESMKVFDFGDGGTHPIGTLLGLLPVVIFYIVTINKKPSLKPDRVLLLAVLTVALAFVGSRIVFLIMHGQDYKWDVFKTWQSGFVLYGGLVIGVLAGVWYAWYKKQPILKLADIAAPSIMLGLVFGRIGCFLNGCCFGARCNLPWGVSFPRDSPAYAQHTNLRDFPPTATGSFPVHPTQIYEAVFALVMFFVLSKFLLKVKTQGGVFIVMCLFYSAWRFLVEFFRDDPGRAELTIPGLSFSQTVSIFVFVASAAILVTFRLKSQAAAQSSSPPTTS